MKIEKESGYIAYYEIDDTEEGWEGMEGWMIDTVYVSPEHRGEGKGRQLLQEALADLDSKKVAVCLTLCPQDKDTDIEKLAEFYESEGFEIESSDDRPYPLMKR